MYLEFVSYWVKPNYIAFLLKTVLMETTNFRKEKHLWFVVSELVAGYCNNIYLWIILAEDTVFFVFVFCFLFLLSFPNLLYLNFGLFKIAALPQNIFVVQRVYSKTNKETIRERPLMTSLIFWLFLTYLPTYVPFGPFWQKLPI